MYGIKVDAAAIARGLLEMVPDMGENYENALAFGMLPAPLMDSLHRLLGEKFDELASEQLGVSSDEIADMLDAVGLRDMGEDMQRDLATNRKKWIAHVQHQVALEMYKAADMVV